MKMSQASRLLTLSVAMGVLTVLAVGTAMAGEPKQVTRVHQPTGNTKASALAPRATKRRVFGAPIQKPIVRSAPRKKPPR
jgi:hypothetical protein